MGTMVCGHTAKEGPTIYYVDSDGTRLKVMCFVLVLVKLLLMGF